MKEDIKNLEEIINLCKEEINNNDKNITAILDLEDLKSLMNLLTGYKQLEEDNEQLEAIKDEAIRRYNFESIPVSKVKEKKKEIKSKGICKNTDFCNNSCFYYSTCNVLQDILERSREYGI